MRYEDDAMGLVKTATQIGHIRKLAVTISEILAESIALVRPGLSTRELDAAIEAIMARRGVNGPCKGYEGFPAVSCISVNEVVTHGKPDGRVLALGDIVDIDLVIEKGEVVAARNAITAVNDRGSIVAGYAKAHLVPYGEYLALRWLLEPLGATRLVPGALDFWPGPGPRSYDFGPWGKAGMQICYEIVFSGEVVDRRDRPDYIFNPSNDGWFGSWGPPQHLAQARLRAIEEGLPVLRATTTGISAVIDADGIVRQYVPRHRAGRLDGRIPYAHPPTLFARLGNLLPLAWAALLLAISLVAMRRRGG